MTCLVRESEPPKRAEVGTTGVGHVSWSRGPEDEVPSSCDPGDLGTDCLAQPTTDSARRAQSTLQVRGLRHLRCHVGRLSPPILGYFFTVSIRIVISVT